MTTVSSEDCQRDGRQSTTRSKIDVKDGVRGHVLLQLKRILDVPQPRMLAFAVGDKVDPSVPVQELLPVRS